MEMCQEDRVSCPTLAAPWNDFEMAESAEGGEFSFIDYF